MPRAPRLLLPHSYYHVMTRGNNRNIVFKSGIDYLYYLDVVRKYKENLPFDLYHYCLMPNHVHFLIKTRNEMDFSLFMKKLNLSYFHYYRRRYGWIGHFWQDRYKSQPVGKDSYFIQCGKYIELNPVRGNLTRNPGDYYYSSYNYYVAGEGNDLVTKDFFYEDMGKSEAERQKRYSDMVISDVVMNNYPKRIWGSNPERYNEAKKITNHGR